jgi:hypothetical protein
MPYPLAHRPLSTAASSLEDVMSGSKAARLTVAATVMLAILPMGAAASLYGFN